MDKPSRLRWANLRVGLVVTIAIAILFWASFSGGGTSIFEPKNEFTAYFQNIDGLLAGSPIWMAGVEVGNVKSIKFVNLDSLRVVQIVGRVKEDVWPMVTTKSEVALGTIGFLGDKYVEVFPSHEGDPLEEGGILPTRDIGSAEDLFAAGEDAMNEAGGLVRNLDTVLTRINDGRGTLGQMAVNDTLYHSLTSLMTEMTRLTAALQKNQERITVSLEQTASAVADLSAKVNENQGTIGRLVNDPKLYDNLATSTARLDTIMQRINMAEGSLGLLVNDTSLYNDVSNLLVRASNLIADIQARPREYFKFSVF